MQQTKNQFAEAELKVSFTPSKNPFQISSTGEVESFLYEIWDKELLHFQEQFYVLYLNHAKEIVCWRCLHTGMVTSCVMDFRLLFGFAFGCAATNIIIAHNHPSGKLKPSQADISLTIRVKKLGELLGVALTDHFILAGGKSLSFREEGLL